MGDNVDKSDGLPFKNTVYRYIKDETDIGERAGNVEYYLLDGTQVLNQGMEFGLQGQYSLCLLYTSSPGWRSSRPAGGSAPGTPW